MGGFADGILFHQVLQIHGMLSAMLPRTSLLNEEINMFWDGIFHAVTWLATAADIGLLWRSARRTKVTLPTSAFGGSLLIGWGLFNLVEGSVNHVLLGLHHVVERLGLSFLDWALLAVSLGLIALGWQLIRAATQADSASEVV